MQNVKSFYLHEALYQLKFTSLKTKLLPNISLLCCYNRIFRVLYETEKLFFEKRIIFLAFTICFHKDFCI